jgi:hypothetical protein
LRYVLHCQSLNPTQNCGAALFTTRHCQAAAVPFYSTRLQRFAANVSGHSVSA